MSNTFRKPYTKSKRFDASCRCHGGCPWCEGNRRYTTNKRKKSANEQVKMFAKNQHYETPIWEDSLT